MPTQKAYINLDTLRLAIESSESALQEKVKKRFPLDKWFSGKRLPTIWWVKELAKMLKLPMGFFWLNVENAKNFLAEREKEREKEKVLYFRTDGIGEPPPTLKEEINFLSDLQEWMSGILEEAGREPVTIVRQLSGKEDSEDAAQTLRNLLELEGDWILKTDSKDGALRELMKTIEANGIAITVSGVVGTNNHVSIPVEECRGFALVDPYIPWIFINANDAPAAQLFTLAHELVHIALGKSAADQLAFLEPSSNNALERFCNAVAGAFLLPAPLMENLSIKTNNVETLDEYLSQLNKQLKASEAAIARRLVELQKLNPNLYKAWYRKWWKQFQEQKRKKKTSRGKGGNFRTTARKRLSNLFIDYVKRALDAELITYKEFYQKLPYKPQALNNIFQIQ